jgi:hypothetical protein
MGWRKGGREERRERGGGRERKERVVVKEDKEGETEMERGRKREGVIEIREKMMPKRTKNTHIHTAHTHLVEALSWVTGGGSRKRSLFEIDRST